MVREMYSLRIFYAAQCSGLHVFQFSSDYSPSHEELTKTKQNKTIISENPVWMSQSKYLKSNN